MNLCAMCLVGAYPKALFATMYQTVALMTHQMKLTVSRMSYLDTIVDNYSR